MYSIINHCRACGLGRPELSTLKISTAAGPGSAPQKLIEILDLGVSPLANDFCGDGEERSGFAPLKLMWCPRCSLAQLSVVVNPTVLYKNYPYLTSHGQTMMEHFKLLTEDLLKECKRGSVIEIGSNDGTFLDHCLKQGFSSAIGIEPAENLCKIAKKNGITTRNEFFNERVARELSLEGVTPDLIVARHVFCHIDNWQEAIHALGLICGKETVIAIEVPYLPDTIKKCEWDQIYHEHLSYMTVKAFSHALEGSMLHIHATKKYTIHGGAIVLLLRRNDSESTQCYLEPETLSLEDMRAFSEKAKDLPSELRKTIISLIGDGKSVVGYGASAKATQWIQACGFTRKHIKFVCDETLSKQWKCMPGSDIPVVDSGALTRELPDVAILFAWNFKKECINKEKIFQKNGGKWLIPLPQLEIV